MALEIFIAAAVGAVCTMVLIESGLAWYRLARLEAWKTRNPQAVKGTR